MPQLRLFPQDGANKLPEIKLDNLYRLQIKASGALCKIWKKDTRDSKFSDKTMFTGGMKIFDIRFEQDSKPVIYVQGQRLHKINLESIFRIFMSMPTGGQSKIFVKPDKNKDWQQPAVYAGNMTRLDILMEVGLVPGGVDKFGIKILTLAKQGGLLVEEFSYKRSSHNTGTRDTFSKVIGGVMNLGFQGYFKTSLTKNSEEYSFKVHGGTHTGDGDNKTTRQGRCIALGLQQDGKPSFKIEHPHHSDTPDFSDKVTFFDPNFKNTGSVKGKWIGLAGFVTVDPAAKKANYELWVDVDGLKNGKPANNWKPMYKVENTNGKFKNNDGDPIECYLENQGIANGGQGIFYLRIDTVTTKTETFGFKVYEIEKAPSKN